MMTTMLPCMVKRDMLLCWSLRRFTSIAHLYKQPYFIISDFSESKIPPLIIYMSQTITQANWNAQRHVMLRQRCYPVWLACIIDEDFIAAC